MENYICIAKSFFERTLDKGCKIYQNELEMIQSLKAIRTLVNLTEDEITILESANELLIDKLEIIEELIDNKDNVFYNYEDEDEE